MKVTIYTINDAESDFCKQAKDFLTAHNIQFENKDVEHDRKALSEMLAVSDNFSGVPVIVIEEEGAEKKVLKGFTQQEVEQALGLSAQTTPPVSAPEVPAPVAAQTEPFDSAQGVAVAPEKVEPTTQPLDQTMSAQAAAPAASFAPAQPDPVMPTAMPNQDDTTAMPATAPVPAADDTVMPQTPAAMPTETPAAPTDTAPAMPAASQTEPASMPSMTEEKHDDQLKSIMDTLAQNGGQTTPSVEATPEPMAMPMPAAPTETPAPMNTTPASAEPTMPSMPAEPTPVAPAMDAQATEQPAATPDAAPAPTGDMPHIPDFPQK